MRGFLGAFLAALFALAPLSAWAAPSRFEIGTATTSTGVSSFTVTTTADCPVGNVIAVFEGSMLGGSLPASITDNASTPNTYTLQAAVVNSGSTSVQAAVAPVTSDLPLGGTITITLLVGSTFNAAIVDCASGLATSSVVDINGAGSTGNGTAVSFGPTSTLAQASELAYGFVASDSSMQPLASEGAGFTTVDNQGPLGYSTLNVAYRITSATTALTYAPTLQSTTSDHWSATILTLKAAASSTAKAPSTLLLMGAGS
jgi:hypothetical protein